MPARNQHPRDTPPANHLNPEGVYPALRSKQAQIEGLP
jgi:hypothetical protein